MSRPAASETRCTYARGCASASGPGLQANLKGDTPTVLPPPRPAEICQGNADVAASGEQSPTSNERLGMLVEMDFTCLIHREAEIGPISP